MHPTLRLTTIFLLGLGFSFALPVQGAAEYGISPKPAWVAPISFLEPGRRQAEDGGSARFFLADIQVNLTPLAQRYAHYAARALNAEGIEQLGKLTLVYDPRTEKMNLHDLSILRQGKRIPQLRKARVSVTTTDAGLRQVTFHLDDMQIDDVLDYQYTLTALRKQDDKYAASFKLRWPVPVDRAQVRILSPHQRKLDHRIFNLNLQPELRRRGALNELVLLLDNVSRLSEEDQTPPAFVTDSLLQVSEYSTWDEVQSKFKALYRNNEPLPPILENLAEQWLRGNVPAQAAALAALAYVQRDIENLPGGMLAPPSTIEQLVTRRAGTARDKAQLFVALLNRLGIEAYPALVSSSRHQGIVQFLPAPDLFDHVVVLAYLDGAPYWLDPTRLYQAGPLAERSVAQFHTALVLDDSTGGITDMAFPTYHARGTFVHQQFLAADYRAPVKLVIQTEYHGLYAENARALLARHGVAELTQARTRQLARFYPQLQSAELGQWHDDEKRNSVLVTERFVIPDFFDYADGYFISKYFVSQEAIPGLKTPEQAARTTPFALVSPFDFHQTTEINLPSAVQEKPLERHEVSNPHLHYLSTRLQEANRLQLAYQLENRQEWVPPEAIAQYRADLQKVRDSLSHTLVQTVAAQSEIQRIYESFPAVALGLLNQGEKDLHRDAARIQAAIETGWLSDAQRLRAEQQLSALRSRLNPPPRQ